MTVARALATLLALTAAVATASAKPMCARTWKNREHLHPKVHTLPPPTEAQTLEMAALPAALDWCDQGFCTPSWNQHIPHYCGSCFAHGALSAAQDRIKMMHKAAGYVGPDVQLGRQSFLNCGPAHGLSDGCGGGEPQDVFEFMHHYGLPDETCVPYSATDYRKYTETNGTCPPEGYCMNCITTPDHPSGPHCFPVTTVVRYRAETYGRVSGEHAMMKELLNGPITCGVACSDEFSYNYSAGIFHDQTGFLDIDHDVEIVGWGVDDDGTKFWNVRNSWGTYWGMQGFFKIVRGVNNLGIEADCHWVRPGISDEQLIFSETDSPLYGGSLWGIKPFSAGAAASHPVNSTDDVVLSSLPLTSTELPPEDHVVLPQELPSSPAELKTAAQKKLEAASAQLRTIAEATVTDRTVAAPQKSAGLSILALFAGFAVFGALVAFAVARFTRGQTYTRLI